MIADSFYIEFIESIRDNSRYGHIEPTSDSPTLMIEYSSPNTNKPLHLGNIEVTDDEIKDAFDHTLDTGRIYLYDHLGSLEGYNLLELNLHRLSLGQNSS